jgi:hypothetical protein
VASDDGPSGEHSLPTDGHTRPNEHLCSDPRAVLQNNRPVAIWHIGFAVIVVASAQERPLGDAAVGTYCHRLEIQNKNLFADPGKITYGQFPGEMNVYTGLNHCALADFCSKASENQAF